MSMPKRLRQVVAMRFGPLSKSLEQQFQTREDMIVELERRGYRVREKTDEQIVQMIRRGL
jgi:Mn-dependent DtxR family transcriptional regulator